MEETTEDKWRRRVAEFKASGLTAREYARRNGFHETTLSQWGRVLAAKAAPPSPTLSLARLRRGAVPLTINESEATLELMLRRATVRVRPGFDPALLRAVVAALSEDD
jgi:transposase